MLNRKTLVSIIAIVCCADMAFGAASLRIGGTQNATGTTARAGTLRTGSVKLAGVTPKSSVSGGTATPTTIGRLATSTGGSSVGNSHGRISGHGSGASAAALDELERRVNALADDYGRLDGQYDRLSNDVNYAATTATSANTGINNLRTRVDTVEGKITGLENQGVDTATINGLIDNKIGNFPTKNEVTTQINTASEALMDYADSTGMTETERQELTRLSSAVDTKLSISDAENTYATKTQLNNAIVGNESVLADYVQTTYANAHFATKPEVNTLSERVDSAATSVNSLNAMVSDQASVVANANNKVTALENAVVALDNAVSDKVGVTTYNNLVTEVSNALGGKADQSVVNGLDARITANASTIAEHTNALADRVTSTQLSQALADVQAGNVDESTINAMIQNALGENTTFVTTSVYTQDKENTDSAINSLNTLVSQHTNKITALENIDLSDYETSEHVAATYAKKTDLNFLCDDPDFTVNTVIVDEVPKSRVTVSCDGQQKGTFDIATGGGSGGNGTVCGVALDKTILRQDSNNPTKITGYRLQFKDTCTNEQVGDDIIVNNGEDGAAGQDADPACATIITANKVGSKTTLIGRNSCTNEQEWSQEVDDGAPGAGIEYQGIVQTCSELRIHNGATKGYAWFNKQDNLLYISDGSSFPSCPDGGVPFQGDQGEPGCGVITSTSDKIVGDKTIGKTITVKNACNNDVIETFDILNGENGQDGNDGCGVTTTTANKVVNSKVVGKTVTVKNACNDAVIETFDIFNGENGQDGAPGTGIEYQGIVQTCTELHTHDGATKGYAWFNKQDNLLYISDGSAFPTCPNGGVPFKGDQGEPGEQGEPGCGVITSTANKVVNSKVVGKTVTVKNACNDAVIETFDIFNGENGGNGNDGETPTLTTATVGDEVHLISTTVKGGQVDLGTNIRGPQGPQGEGVCPAGMTVTLRQRADTPNKVDFVCE